MAAVGLFYGSDTGNTENISKMIQKELGANLVDIRDIAKSTKEISISIVVTPLLLSFIRLTPTSF